jgi:hypothetical protein
LLIHDSIAARTVTAAIAAIATTIGSAAVAAPIGKIAIAARFASTTTATTGEAAAHIGHPGAHRGCIAAVFPVAAAVIIGSFAFPATAHLFRWDGFDFGLRLDTY